MPGRNEMSIGVVASVSVTLRCSVAFGGPTAEYGLCTPWIAHWVEFN